MKLWILVWKWKDEPGHGSMVYETMCDALCGLKEMVRTGYTETKIYELPESEPRNSEVSAYAGLVRGVLQLGAKADRVQKDNLGTARKPRKVPSSKNATRKPTAD